ncbi:MAG TPA: sugar phosphate isomerase/epimerase [Gemmatimonadaceae bacterium]|nr:sugar phosphate isomerase/epimerase [Gemmatimonadaceae bacterium]
MTLQNRRTFLATMGAAALGIASRNAWATETLLAQHRKLKKIGIQLYSVRDMMKADLPGTLRKVAAVGYKEVEFAGYFGRTPAQIKELLKKNGLTSPSTHIPIETLEKDSVRAFADAKAIGHQWVTVPWIPEERRKTADSWKQITTLLNQLGPQAKAAGLRLAYHNHDFEFKTVDGIKPYDMMLSQTDPSLVDFEMDLYWVTFAGNDPLDYFNRFPKRFALVHVKDSAGPPDNKMVDVGKGKIDFRAIFAQSDKAGIKHYFVEHDQPTDPMATLRNSYKYLHALRF